MIRKQYTIQTIYNTNNIQYKQYTIQTIYNTNNIQYKEYSRYDAAARVHAPATDNALAVLLGCYWLACYATGNTNNIQYKQCTIQTIYNTNNSTLAVLLAARVLERLERYCASNVYILYPAKYVYEPANRINTLYIYI
jgi:hypothetical protein